MSKARLRFALIVWVSCLPQSHCPTHKQRGKLMDTVRWVMLGFGVGFLTGILWSIFLHEYFKRHPRS